jgi:hypothetical protein
MIGAGFGATEAAVGCLPPRRRSRTRAARASVAARRSVHGGRASCAAACASLGASGVATAVAPGAAAPKVRRGLVAVAGGTVVTRAGVLHSPTCLPERRVLGRCRCGLGAARVSVGRVARPRDRVERRLVCGGRATTAGAAPAGALPRASSVEGADSVGAGSTAAGAVCGADITGAGAAAGGGAGRRGGSSVNGST